MKEGRGTGRHGEAAPPEQGGARGAPAELIRRADELLTQKQPDLAEALYLQALEGDRALLRAYHKLASLTLARGGTEQALAFAQAGLALKPGNAALLHEKAKALRQAGHFAAALDTLRPLLAQMPPRPALLLQAAELARQLGALDEARAHLLRLDLGEKGAKAEVERLVRAYREAKRPAEALDLVRTMQTGSQSDPRLLGAHADLLLALGTAADPHELEDILVRRLENEPSHLKSLLALAALREAGGDRDAAAALLDRARTAHPTHPKPYLRLSALWGRDRPEAAIAWIDRGVDAGAETAPLLREKGRLLASNGRLEAAETIQRALVAGHPEGSEAAAARLDLVSTLRLQGRLDEASELLGTRFATPAEVREAIRLVKDLPRKGRASAAVSLIGKVIARHPRNTAALLAYASLLRELEAYTKAQEMVGRALDIDPTLARAYCLLADLQWQTQSAAAAFATLDAGFARATPSPELYVLAGRIHFQRGEDATATARLQEGLKLFPDHRALLRAAIDQAILSGRLRDIDPLLDALADTPEQRSARCVFRSRRAMVAFRYEEAAAELKPAEMDTPESHSVWIQHLQVAMSCLDMAEARRAERQLRALTRAEGNARATRKVGFFSELFNDMATDPAALVAGRNALLKNDLPQLCAAVRDFPDSTAVALALVVALRRWGHLRGPKPVPATSPPLIPRRVAQFWDSPEPPEDLRAFIESWTALNPGWSHTLYSVASARDFLATHMPAAVLQAFLAARHPAHKADLFRLALLLKTGGV